ncbi:retinitis pigmentosa 1-like 1 protein [Eleutherodactylus coqui]|uniref:retinitis pigmentosa 1-like 1 protein n=1 Tax=Eleutherodactylus coqui TaxID=57060 RepID=UPI0034630B97
MNPSVQEVYSVPPTSPDRPFPPVVRSHAVSEVTPAKKITFFKSGDPQFSGVKMAINRRSFKSFSALMDDLSNKVPLPFGVRTITTPRGTHNISRLEQLQDGGSYICSDKKYVLPIAGRKVGNQRVSRPLSARKQGQPEDPEEEYSATHFQQVPKVRKKIVLVKNGDPTFRRSMLLNRRNARNFRTFLEDASDLLQYTVRRLYTVDGRRIENIQAVLQSTSILICAGKEPFKPIQIENIRKSVTDKLPGLRSHPSHNAEIMDNKKNANFGPKAKKSIIHPRPASSNKTRLSLSSEKSYPNGLNMSPVNSGFSSYANMCPHGKSEDANHSLLNDDIEKKVHVNKDGSLSVEMKVRFRLLNEETLQWSTQIKKSSTIGKTKCEQLCLFDESDKKEETNTENFSETDESFYPCDADSYTSKLNEVGIEDMYCSHCGMQCQEYDIWKNPMHANQQEDYVKRATWQTRSSTSSTSSRHRVKGDQKTSIDSLHSMSSGEYTEHILHRSSHYSETKENGDTMVTYSTVSQCASRSGRSTVASNTDAISDTEQAKRSRSQNKSSSSSKSQGCMRKQQSQLSEEPHCQAHRGSSFEECPEASPTPCSGSDNCSRRVSVVSQSSLHSRKSHMLKRNSTNTKSLASNLSYNEEEEEEETQQPICKGSLKNMQDISMETANSEEPCGSPPIEDKNFSHDNEIHAKHTENASSTDLTKCSLTDYDRRSVGTTSRSSTKSRSSSKKSMKVNGHDEDETSCNSQKSESALIKQESTDVCENSVSESHAALSQSKRKSLTEHKGQSFQSTRSCQSKSSITESGQLNHVQDEHPILNQQGSCNESSSCTEKSDHVACIVNEDGENSLPISRASSKSLSSKFNSISCQENEQVFNVSSRVSSISEKKSIVKSSSSRDSTREMSQEEEAVNDNGVADSSSQTVAPNMDCIHSPSPPEGKPTHKHVRSAQFKLSSNSVSNDQIKTMNGEKSDNSRASTPGSKRILASRASTDTCKKTKNVVTSHNSTEDTQSTKKHKNSSSSSKKKHKGDSLDADNNINSELVPSALPNVTPEEVVNEWLRKIPSDTMVVEYEVEECQKKTQAEIGIDASKTEQEEGDLPKEPIAEENNTNETGEEISKDVQCVNIVNDIQDTNIADGKDNEESVILSKLAGNNVKNEGLPNDIKSLPNNIQTSVQIMKALLSPSQESKFDRSNSLPEVSLTMGRKLSNSAAVLISCLASLQLLDEGQTEITNNTKDLKKTKYTELLNILQALWAEDPTNTSIINIKSGKHYSTDEEVTPVSSSGVDLNSGFEGSGDGSITGGGDHIVTTGKPEDGKLSILVKETECAEKNMQCCQQKEVVSGEHDVASGEESTNEVASFNEDKSCIMDENMNEKKLDSSENTSETEIKEETNEEGHYNAVNNVNDVECTEEAEEHRISNNEKMNILSHSEEPKFNESNSPETNNINSPSDCQSTVISTSDSNGKHEDKQSPEADPVWVLNLLKKIEKEFMTHYVDAMHEFKVRWHLEDNENLDEMIAELKNEVSQRIQKSISNELKKIKARAGNRVPRPPAEGSRRRSSLQADERRRRLQTMHRVSIRQYANGENRGAGSYDFSSETNEEDLTFSASLGEDSNGQPNDEFCPCEKCIRQKRALKLAKPQTVAANAPIIKAFDLQQILKMKQNNDPKTEESDLAAQQNKESEPSIVHDCSDMDEEATNDEDALSKAGEETDKGKSDMSSEDGDVNSQEVKSVMNEYEACDSNDFQEKEPEESENKGPDEETKPIENLEDDLENSNSDALENNSEIVQNVSMEGPEENTSACEETGNNDEEHVSESLPGDEQLASNQEETSETEEHEDELNKTDEVQMATEVSENEDHLVENETTSPDINTEEDVENEDNTEAIENKGSSKRKPFISRGSLITQNGSAEDNETQYKKNHNIGEIAEDTETDCQEDQNTGETAEDTEKECQEDQNTGETAEDAETECQENHNTEETAEDAETECQENHNTEETAEDAETECQENHNTEETAEDAETECQENHNTEETAEDAETECQENHNTEETAEDAETECQENHNTEETAEEAETECQENHNTEETAEEAETECQENHNTEETAEDAEAECQENHNTEETAEDAETECQENHNTGETSPNGQSNGSGSKKSQMYPDSSSENEDGDSPRDSPVGVPKKETIGKVYANNTESFEECDNSKKDPDEDIIDQDEFDF